MIQAPEQLELRDYQEKCKQGTFDLMRQGHKRAILVAPTGAGKRVIGIHLSQLSAEKGRRVLIATDRRILVDQMHRDLAKYGVEYGIVMDGYNEIRDALVQVASIQTIISRYKDGIEWFTPNLILIDECHKNPETYAWLFGIYQNAAGIGLTATPVGGQGKTLISDKLYTAMYEGVLNSELIRRGNLLPTTVICPSAPDIKGLKPGDNGEFNQKKLAGHVADCTAFGDLWKEWLPFADRQTILFAPQVAYCQSLVKEFEHRDIPAAIVYQGTKQKQRDKIFEAFAEKEIRVLVSVDVLREGFDAPIASCAIDLQPNAQLRTLWQKVGRIKRAYPGQTDAVYLDMAGNIWKHRLHPDDDPDWQGVQGDLSIQDVQAKKREASKEPAPITCPQCKTVRKGGKKCPACGHECETQNPVKWIRMGNGKLREVPLEEIKKAEKSEAQKIRDKWKSELIAGIHGAKTLKQCAHSFKRKNGHYPPKTLPLMPPYGSVQWDKRVHDLYSMQTICSTL